MTWRKLHLNLDLGIWWFLIVFSLNGSSYIGINIVPRVISSYNITGEVTSDSFLIIGFLVIFIVLNCMGYIKGFYWHLKQKSRSGYWLFLAPLALVFLKNESYYADLGIDIMGPFHSMDEFNAWYNSVDDWTGVDKIDIVLR